MAVEQNETFDCRQCNAHGRLDERVAALKRKQERSCNDHTLIWADMKTKVSYVVFIPCMVLLFGAMGSIVVNQSINAKAIARIDERTLALPEIQETLHEQMLNHQDVLRQLIPHLNESENSQGRGTP